MTMTLKTDLTPLAWIGCLACYNAGYLVGDWFNADSSDEVTVADVHQEVRSVRADCEELWVMDHESIPVSGEMSPHDAAEWARVVLLVPPRDRAALCAWVESGDYVAEGSTDLPSISDFEDRYCGQWDSFREYADDYLESTGLLSQVSDAFVRYFDHSAFVRELAWDYSTYEGVGGGVYVFRDL